MHTPYPRVCVGGGWGGGACDVAVSTFSCVWIEIDVKAVKKNWPFWQKFRKNCEHFRKISVCGGEGSDPVVASVGVRVDMGGSTFGPAEVPSMVACPRIRATETSTPEILLWKRLWRGITGTKWRREKSGRKFYKHAKHQNWKVLISQKTEPPNLLL